MILVKQASVIISYKMVKLTKVTVQRQISKRCAMSLVLLQHDKGQRILPK